MSMGHTKILWQYHGKHGCILLERTWVGTFVEGGKFRSGTQTDLTISTRWGSLLLQGPWREE